MLMQRPSRRVSSVLGVLLALTATVAVAATSSGIRARPVPSVEQKYGENARRFLALTSPTPAGSLRARAASDTTQGPAPEVRGQFTPQGWNVTPVGRQVSVFNFPLGMTQSPDGGKVVVSSDNGGMQGLTVIDTGSLATTYTPAANLFMGVSVTPDGRVLASGGNANRVFRYRMVGSVLAPQDLTEAALFPNHGPRDAVTARIPGAPMVLPASDGIGVPGYPGASVLQGRYLYVAGTMSEPSGIGGAACPSGQPACGRVTVIDLATDTVVGRAPVGLDAIALAIDLARKRLYVANWADESGRGAGVGGTVSVLDISDPIRPSEVAWVRVGNAPTALQLSKDRRTLFVANTNDDTISVLDVSGKGSPAVVATESVSPETGVPVGAHPDALALSPDGETLYVALAGMNAVEVRDGRSAARLSGAPVYIPTGWYPSALQITRSGSRGYRLWVANAKGAGASTASGTGLNLSVAFDGNPLTGTVSVIDLPSPKEQEQAWAAQVRANDRLDQAGADPCNPGGGIVVSEVLCPPAGKSSPVKHVVYIVTENKTFDQYFGDLPSATYDVDPKYLLYGQPVTPNHHALVNRFSLSDRFFSDAQVSVTGHSWTSGGIATDANEKDWAADYDQGLRGVRAGSDPLRPSIADKKAADAISGAEDELQDPEGGYLFEAFKRAGAVPPDQAGPGKLSMAIYGERTARESGNMNAYKAPGWKDGDIQYFDTCRAAQFITGAAPDGPVPNNAPDQFQDCKGRTLPAQFNLAYWTRTFRQTGQDVMPNFIYMSLPVNHTLGTNLFSPTPASMVADNDYAIGQIVEALSKSPFWASTVVMQTEDDTQVAGDHISPLRDYLQVVGPWAKPGPNHQWGSMPSLLRTIELLFGVQPITLNDRLAIPQHGAFRTSLSEAPDTAPYTAIRPAVPFALNQPGAPGQGQSMAMDWSSVDRIDMATLNAILYAVARGTRFVPPVSTAP